MAENKEQDQERPEPLQAINVLDEAGKKRRLAFSADAKEIVAAGGKYASPEDEKRAMSVRHRKV